MLAGTEHTVLLRMSLLPIADFWQPDTQAAMLQRSYVTKGHDSRQDSQYSLWERLPFVIVTFSHVGCQGCCRHCMQTIFKLLHARVVLGLCAQKIRRPADCMASSVL